MMMFDPVIQSLSKYCRNAICLQAEHRYVRAENGMMQDLFWCLEDLFSACQGLIFWMTPMPKDPMYHLLHGQWDHAILEKRPKISLDRYDFSRTITYCKWL